MIPTPVSPCRSDNPTSEIPFASAIGIQSYNKLKQKKNGVDSAPDFRRRQANSSESRICNGNASFFEYLFRKHEAETSIEGLRQKIRDSEGLVHYWTDWILNIEDEHEQAACLVGFINELNNRWKIGRTYTFSIIRQEKGNEIE